MYTISDLWNGNIAPCEHCGADDELANCLYHKMQQQRMIICEEFSDSQIDRFEKFMECSEDYLLRMMELAFSEGYSIGSNLTRESMLA